MADPVISVANLSKVYQLYDSPMSRLKEAFHPFKKSYHKDFYALKDINLRIEKNQSVGIIGMNGSGKSTLLKVITKILTPTQGSVHVAGKISALLELGAGFNPEFSGLENAKFQCSLQGFGKEETRDLLPEILEFADIGHFIHQPVKTYSSGMYVRLAFAVAINVQPDVLVVDEALAVGDTYFQAKCMEKIKGFMASGKTLLFVSHDPGAVKSLCDKAYLLNKGELVDEGDPDEVFNYYNALIAEKNVSRAMPSSQKESLRQRSGNKKMQIASATIVNEKGVATETLVSGEKVHIRIEAIANETIENPTIGFLIRDRLGNDIFGINNYFMQQTTGTIKPGESLKVDYTLPLNLGPNVYNLTIAAHSDDTHIGENYDWVNNAVVFKVIPSNDLKFLGFCRLQPEFTSKVSIASRGEPLM